MFHNFLSPLKQATASLSELPASVPLANGPKPGTSTSQTRFTVWLCLGNYKCSTGSSHLRLLYSSGKVAPSRTQVGADLGLHHPGNSRASTTSGHLQSMSEPLHPALLILPGGQRLVVSGHSHSLQLMDLGKPLPLICHQQPWLNYKRRVY